MNNYHVWTVTGVYVDEISAEDEQQALNKAKTIHKVHAPMVQNVQHFIEQWKPTSENNHQHICMNQQLRYADIKASEQRTWRDRRY
jgi:hypothetical protein